MPLCQSYNPRMILVLDDIMALQFYRLIYPAHRKPARFVKLPESKTGFANKEADVWSYAPQWITPSFLEIVGGKLGFLVFEKNALRRSKTHRGRIWSGPVPEGSFHDLGDGVYVPSAQFTFLLMASRLSLIQLVALGHELCGTYSFDDSKPRGMRKREVALSTLLELEEFIRLAGNLPGRRKAERALRYISNGSASPMETRDKMQFCMPFMYGGYALGPHEFNYEVELDQQASRIARKSRCRIDHYWPTIGEGCEYQGEYDHLSPEKYSRDRSRINALRSMGYPIYEMTYKHVSDLDQFESIALMLAKKMHKQIPASCCGATPERLSLRKELMLWNEHSGRTW